LYQLPSRAGEVFSIRVLHTVCQGKGAP